MVFAGKLSYHKNEMKSLKSRKRRRSNSLTRVLPFPFLGGGAGTLFLLFICLTLLGISALNPTTLEGVRMRIVDGMTPFIKTMTGPIQSGALMVRDMTGISQLQAENTRLQEENARLREWYQTALFLESENKSLRTLLNVKEEAPQRFITARIISDSGNRFVKTLLVAAGQGDNIRKGQAALAGDGMIGRIIEVGSQASRVLLLTDVNSRVPVFVGEGNQHAILSGDNSELPTLKHLNKDSSIEVGARVVTSGHGGMFAPGLPIGQVVKTPEGNYAVALFADLGKMVYVRIVDTPENEGFQRIESAP